MTTANSSLSQLAGLALQGASVPSDLPDPELLSRLATEIFNQLPNGQNCVGNLGASVPQSSATGHDLANVNSLINIPSFDTQVISQTPIYEVPSHSIFETLRVSSQSLNYYFLESQNQTELNHHNEKLLDIQAIRRDFPILNERVNCRQLVWFDNAATTQKPKSVIDRISYFYQHENSNIHRAAHELAGRATDAYENAREITRNFINARSTNEIVFVRGTTEAINLVAKSWGRQNIGKGDEIVVSNLEHHANIVPWKQLADEVGAILKVAPVDDSGQIILEEYEKLVTPRTKLVSFTQVSNALGTITPAVEMARIAKAQGAKVLIDGAQSVCHLRTDVQLLNCDWFVFSGHKIFAPTGIGVLYGREEILNATQPWQGGGNMIKDVTFDRIQYHDAPGRFEAGTGNIADAVGLGSALEYVEKIGIENIARHEHALLEYANHLLNDIPSLHQIGTAQNKASVISFTLDGYKTEEVGKALNQEGIAVRSGHHCAQPILRRFGLETTVRPSFSVYNTFEEIDLLAVVIRKLANQKSY